MVNSLVQEDKSHVVDGIAVTVTSAAQKHSTADVDSVWLDAFGV